MILTHKNQIKNIAVCFSGEPRFYKNCSNNINNFFKLNNVNVYYFAHIWNSNTLKTNEGIVKEEFSVSEIREDISKYFNFEKLNVEQKFDPSYWLENMYYSDATSNFLKCQFEKENDMKFDVVVKCRTDLAFDPSKTFLDIINNDIVQFKTIYANNWPFSLEWLLPNVDDCFYFGDSNSMDIIMQNMPHVTRNIYKELRNDVDFKNNPYMMYGPGVSMYQWIKQVNMTVEKILPPYFIFRNDSVDIDLNTDYDRASKISRAVPAAVSA